MTATIALPTTSVVAATDVVMTKAINQAVANDGFEDSDDSARETIAATVAGLHADIAALSQAIHAHPETGYKEVFAHAALTDFLDAHGFRATRHAYGLDTSFCAEAGSGGRLVVICAEYDALPGIGHGCGHNLIAASSVAAFVGAAAALRLRGCPGRVRILGTPAEEGGGGKIKLIEAGAFVDETAAAAAAPTPAVAVAAASIMCHPLPQHQLGAGWRGTAGFRTVASRRFRVAFHGCNAHAGAQPWDGRNALDAAVTAYAAVGLLRQQVRPYERLQGIIEDGGAAPNVIPDYACMAWGLRSRSVAEVDALYERVQDCMRGAATAAGCRVEFSPMDPYMELRVNDTLCREYMRAMQSIGQKILYMDAEPSSAGTDMGNVSHAVPGFHGVFGIPTLPGVPVHNRAFADAAATCEANDQAIEVGKGLAMLAFRVLTDDAVAASVMDDFLQGRQAECVAQVQKSV